MSNYTPTPSYTILNTPSVISIIFNTPALISSQYTSDNSCLFMCIILCFISALYNWSNDPLFERMEGLRGGNKFIEYGE